MFIQFILISIDQATQANFCSWAIPCFIHIADLPTWLNRKPGGSGPKTFLGSFRGAGGYATQKSLEISVLRLAENALPTF